MLNIHANYACHLQPSSPFVPEYNGTGIVRLMNCPSLDSEKSSLRSGSWMELPILRHHIASILLHLWGHNLLLSHFPIEPVTEFLLFFFFFESSQYYFMIYMTVDKISASLCSHLLNSIITLPLQNCHEESAHSCAW